MKTSIYIVTLFIALAVVACGDGGDGPSPSETRGDPPDSSGTIPEGSAGMGGSADGQSTSLGAPAPCASDEECPDGVSCMIAQEGQLGFCDISEMQAP